MKFRFAASLILMIATAPACAQPAPLPAGAPRLLIAISVDQFSAALFTEYRQHFTGGLKRMADGVAFANGYQAHGATETCPGHSTILTGSHPARSGVIANDWYDFAAPRGDKHLYCAEDEAAAGSSFDNYTVSSVHQTVPALGDRMKQAYPASRTVSVAGKDRSAAMLGGRAPDQRWWWKSGKFVSNGAAPARVLDQVNGAIGQGIAQARPALIPPPFCAGKDKAYDLGNGRSVGTFRFDRKAGDATAFGTGPELDAATLALAAALIRDMQLGRGAQPDLIAIGLAATDLVGHRYGPGGLEMCLQLASLDKDLGDFFAFLDQEGIDYAVVLTADHGSLDIPERLREQGIADAARLDGKASVGIVGAEIGKQLGIAGPSLVGDGYVAPTVPADRRQEVLTLARTMFTDHAQVEKVFSRAELAAHPMPKGRPEDWTLIDRLRASFDHRRSSDLIVVYKPHIQTSPVAGHGSPWDYDRKVPILFWRRGMAAQDRPESAMTADIMPTLASLVGVAVPAGEIDGTCLDLMPGDASNCR